MIEPPASISEKLLKFSPPQLNELSATLFKSVITLVGVILYGIGLVAGQAVKAADAVPAIPSATRAIAKAYFAPPILSILIIFYPFLRSLSVLRTQFFPRA